MDNIISFPEDIRPKVGFHRVQATYTVREIGRQFGLSEQYIRRWTRDGLIPTISQDNERDLRYDFHALVQFRHIRELRSQGLTLKQIDSELRGQLNLFPQPAGQLIPLPMRRSAFKEALLMHEGGDRRAVALYRQAIQEGEAVADAYCNLGVLNYEAGNTIGAFDQFTRSLKHDPRHFESHFNLASLYFEAGDLRLSQLHYEIALEIEPDSCDLYFNLGLVMAMRGDFAAAITALSRAREVAAEPDPIIDDLLTNLRSVMDPHRQS